MKMIFLVDGDNNIGTGLQGADQLTAEDSVLVFYQKTGLALSKIKELCKGSKASIQYLESVKGGKNSIDFQIITELGVLVGRGEADCAYVISQDKGYEAAMSALRARYAGAFREVALRPSIAACLKASFLLRTASLPELEESLSQEFGAVQGASVFRHLRELFQPAAEPAAPAEEKAAPGQEEKPAAKRTQRRRRPAVPAQKAAEKTGEKAGEKSPEQPGGSNIKKTEEPAAKPVPETPRAAASPAATPAVAAAPAAAAKPAAKTTYARRGKRKKKEGEAAL